MTNKKPKYPIHKMGKHWGYEEFEDGSIIPAPLYTDNFDRALESEDALREMMDIFVERMHKLFNPIFAAKKHFWDSLRDDYGLDPENFEFTYDRKTKKVGKVKKTPKTNE
ncbi:MAG: hypothetical protein M3367_03255 [Acidobacteriota bacterium]|nr:hypothetical protein [Acidobacteriota bacterium]